MSQNMDIYSVLLLSVGLAMDAFSVALVAGFGMGKVKLADSLKISGTFGLAHIIMPIAGWFLGSSVLELIQRWDHRIAFLLLAFVGGKMLKEGLDEDADDLDANELLGLGSLLMFTVAVSIDALAVGLSFSVQGLSIWVPSLYMGASTLIFTFVGLNVGNRTGQRFGKRAQVFGGIVLILIGLRIALAQMGLLG
jgi:putative Mn2+ efflux pump MntP